MHDKNLSGKSPKAILRLPITEARTGLKKSTLYRLMREGQFPQCVNLGSGRAVGWLESDVEAWIEKVVAQGKKAQADLLTNEAAGSPA